MKITINQSKLQLAIRSVERVVSKNVSLPILNTILLKTEKGRVKLSATNLELGVYYWVGAKVDEDGVLAIPARLFSEFISSIRDEKIILTSERNTLIIASERYNTKILCMGPEEFPIIPILKNTQEFRISSGDLKNAIGGVIDATSLLETRPELTGVYVVATKKQVTCAATDSFRLSEYTAAVASGIEKSFIIPRTTALEIMRLAADHAEELTVAVAENQIAVRGADFELISRLIDGRYPDYKKVIPDRWISRAIIDRGELDRNVRMASIFSSSISDMSLKAAGKSIRLVAKNSDRGEIAAEVPAEVSGDEFELSVNYRYLLDGIKVLPQPRVAIEYTGPGSPLVLRGDGDTRQVYVIMPLRT